MTSLPNSVNLEGSAGGSVRGTVWIGMKLYVYDGSCITVSWHGLTISIPRCSITIQHSKRKRLFSELSDFERNLSYLLRQLATFRIGPTDRTAPDRPQSSVSAENVHFHCLLEEIILWLLANKEYHINELFTKTTKLAKNLIS